MNQTPAPVITPPAAAKPARPPLTVRKKFLYAFIAITGTLLGLEVVVRVVCFFVYGFSPYHLVYGFRSQEREVVREGLNAQDGGYYKFQPSQVMHQYGMFSKPTPIRINSLGFRGPDFTPEKTPGVFRIICLGESSTFGFYNEDDETYPAILQRIFAERLKTQRVEVINAGIPRVQSDSILAMFKEEIAAYKPDVITIYAGYNDAAMRQFRDEPALQRVFRWLHSHVMTYVVMQKGISSVGGPRLHSLWDRRTGASKARDVEQEVQLRVGRYHDALRDIIDGAQTRGIRVVLIKQGVDMLSNQDGKRTTALTYLQEVQGVRKRLQEEGGISGQETSLLIHYGLMQALEELAKEKQVVLLDNIAILDKHPEYFASYVHLHKDGNQALAEELYKVIEPRLAGRTRANPPAHTVFDPPP
jgi:lysophospholipase L1-like esterase